MNNSQILEAYKGGAAWRDLFELLDLARADEVAKIISVLEAEKMAPREVTTDMTIKRIVIIDSLIKLIKGAK